MIITPFAALGPEIKLFLALVAFAGPTAIIILIFIIKKIEQKNPDRIRWR
tara:strand:- start:621 stop:770 length:150 start_codon:yes stop_codon:yes gene_type:complete